MMDRESYTEGKLAFPNGGAGEGGEFRIRRRKNISEI